MRRIVRLIKKISSLIERERERERKKTMENENKMRDNVNRMKKKSYACWAETDQHLWWCGLVNSFLSVCCRRLSDEYK